MPQAPNRTERARALLQEADLHLQQAQELIRSESSDYASILSRCLRAVRQSLRGFLTWHDVPFREETTLRELVRHAEGLASMFRTPGSRALKLEELEASLPQKQGGPGVAERQIIRTGVHIARNLHHTTLGELPASVHPA